MPHTFAAAEVLTAATLNAWADFGSYTPTVKLGATTLSISNDSRYSKIGKLTIVTVQFRITNLNGGTGTLTISRPTVGRMSSLTNNYSAPLGTSSIFDVSATAIYHGVVAANAADGSDIVFRSAASPGVAVTNTAPITLAAGASGTGDEIYCNFVYESTT